MKEQDGGGAGETCGSRVSAAQEKKGTVGWAYNPTV
jgi:hypothetical protein